MSRLKQILSGSGVYVIAEAGVNHNGDVALAEQLVDVAAASGADAVKFQLFDPDELASSHAPKADYQKKAGATGSQVDMLKSLTLPHDAYAKLAKRARTKQIDFIVTPFDALSARFLVDLDVDAIKIPSGEITNLPFLKQVAALNTFTIISTGMSTIEEVQSATQPFTDQHVPYALLHCVSSYPAPADQIHLRAMETLRSHFHVPIGYSDHSEGAAVAIAAVSLGAKIIEKHFTLDRTLPGPDHAASLEPDELHSMIRDIRIVECALGSHEKQCQPCEQNVRSVARRSLVVCRPLQKGDKITREHIAIQRPGTGLPPSDLSKVIGKSAKNELPVGTVLQSQDLQ
jgi:N-acetylneuraminate synthase